MAAARSLSWSEVAREAGPPLVVWREGARTVISLRGEQDMSTAVDLAEALAAAGTVGRGDVVVDMSDVQFMDSAIVTELVRARQSLRSQSRTLMLRTPSRFARRLLDMCGLVGSSDPRQDVARRVVLPQLVPRPPGAERPGAERPGAEPPSPAPGTTESASRASARRTDP